MGRHTRHTKHIVGLVGGVLCILAVLINSPTHAANRHRSYLTDLSNASPVSPLVATARVGRAPTTLAVDERQEHVFVVNYGLLYTANTHPSPHAPPGSVSMLDAVTGRVLRTTMVGAYPGPIVVSARTGRAFVASAGPLAASGASTGHARVNVLDTATGTLVRAIPIGAAAGGLAVDEAAGYVYVLTDTGVAVLDATTGRLLRSIRGVIGSEIAVDPRAKRALVTGGSTLALLDLTTGTLLITATNADGAQAPVVDTRTERAFFLLGNFHNGLLRAVDARTGATLYDFPMTVESTAIAVGESLDRVYVDSYDGQETDLSTLDETTGKQVYAAPLGPHASLPYRPGGGQYLAVDAPAKRVFALTVQPPVDSNNIPVRPGHLMVVNAVTGRVVGSGATVGKDPQAVAVDTKRGRVFVVNRGDNTVSVFDASRL
jgi:DNA-binding beta-propeller fold protein YncE